MRDEVTEATKIVPTKTFPAKSIPTNFNKKKVTCKTKNLYILLAFILVTIALLAVVDIHPCFLKYQAKHFFPFHFTNDKLEKVLY